MNKSVGGSRSSRPLWMLKRRKPRADAEQKEQANLDHRQGDESCASDNRSSAADRERLIRSFEISALRPPFAEMETSRWLAFWLPVRPILFRRFARQPSDGGGVNSRVYTGRAISPTHARTRSRATIAQRRGTQDIGSDGERSRSYFDRGGRTLGSGARRAHRAATP